MIRRFRALYGAGPVNLLVLIACFAIAGAAVVGWFQRPRDVTTTLEWFAAAIVLHDLVVVPLYSLLDRIVFARQRRRAKRSVVSLVNSTPYLRIPAILSGLLFAVFFPVIFGLGAQAELNASGIPERGYLTRWLIASGVMFAVSGVAYGVAAWRALGPGGARVPGPGVAPGPRVAPEPAGGPEPASLPEREGASLPEPTAAPSPERASSAGPESSLKPLPNAPTSDGAPPPTSGAQPPGGNS